MGFAGNAETVETPPFDAGFKPRAGLSLKWLKMVFILLLSIGVWFGLVW
jgi:hypothetical protein